MFGVELLREDNVTQRATIVSDNIDEALSSARDFAVALAKAAEQIRVIDRCGGELGTYPVKIHGGIRLF